MGAFVGDDHCRLWEESDQCRGVRPRRWHGHTQRRPRLDQCDQEWSGHHCADNVNGDDDHDGEVEEDDEDDKLVTTFNIKSIYKKNQELQFPYIFDSQV